MAIKIGGVTVIDDNRNIINIGNVTADGYTGVFPSGTALLFQQTSAPTGWTKLTTHNNKALRVVSGTAASGGTLAFTSAFASRTPAGTVSVSGSNSGGSVSDTTLTISQIPSHSHSGSTNSGGAHTHGITDPGHRHGINTDNTADGQGDQGPEAGTVNDRFTNFATTGITINSGGAHTHGIDAQGGGTAHGHGFTNPTWAGTATFTGSALDFSVQYVDVIIATKD